MNRPLLFVSFVGLLGLLTVGPSHAQSGGPNTIVAQGSSAAPVRVVNPDSVYINPEVLPRFTGGDQAFSAYLSKHIRYPQQALQRRISGRVFVSFVLNAQGKVQDAHVVKGPGNGLDDEALRLVWMMPPWEPGRVNGQAVRVACTVPISFNSGR